MEATTFNKSSLFEHAMSISNKELKELCLKHNIDISNVLEKHELANLLSENQIKMNKKKLFKNDECSICYDQLGEKNNCTTPCGHIFCFECMMQALNRNNLCPCCRAPLREEPEESEDEEESEYEEESEGEDEYEWNPLDENINDWRRRSIYLQNMRDPLACPAATPKVLAKKIQDAGYTMEDLVSIWCERIDRSNDRYKDNNFVKKMVSDIENLVDNEDQEVEIRESEMELMGQEDQRGIEIESRDIFERFPDLDLNVLFNNM